jgi:hypothetical protein
MRAYCRVPRSLSKNAQCRSNMQDHDGEKPERQVECVGNGA